MDINPEASLIGRQVRISKDNLLKSATTKRSVEIIPNDVILAFISKGRSYAMPKDRVEIVFKVTKLGVPYRMSYWVDAKDLELAIGHGLRRRWMPLSDWKGKPYEEQ